MKNYNQAQDNYDSMAEPEYDDEPEEVEEPATWRCCGGVVLTPEDRCPMCGDEY